MLVSGIICVLDTTTGVDDDVDSVDECTNDEVCGNVDNGVIFPLPESVEPFNNCIESILLRR